MCGSLGDSLLFAFLHLCTALYARNSPLPIRNAYVVFCVFYASMEICQAGQWSLNPDGTPDCTDANRALTYVAYALVHLQPVLFAAIGYLCVNRARFLFALALACVACASAALNAAAAAYTTERLPTGMNFGNATCTRVGAHHHLEWRFAVRSADLHPNYWYYMSAIALCCALYRRADERWNTLGWTLGGGWALAFLFAWRGVGASAELPGYWCWLSVVADVPILLQCARARYVRMLQDKHT